MSSSLDMSPDEVMQNSKQQAAGGGGYGSGRSSGAIHKPNNRAAAARPTSSTPAKPVQREMDGIRQHDLFEGESTSGKSLGIETSTKLNLSNLDDNEDVKVPGNTSLKPVIMDNVPLKTLFGLEDSKVFQSQMQDKRLSLESPSATGVKGHEPVRQKLRENLADALRSGASKESSSNDEASLLQSDVHLPKESQHLSSFVGRGESFSDGDAATQSRGSNGVDDDDIKAVSGVLNDQQPAATYPSKRAKVEAVQDVEETSASTSSRKDNVVDYAKVVAFAVEAELFRNFGSVNKKYKERARSLLFNLKDRNNPELRVKVLSGEISPENLCGMTAEQLASKELSEWRMAKAEELAQMVVLTDADIDPRRMVKKTHKGEFSVEAAEKESVEFVPTTSKTSLAVQTGNKEKVEAGERAESGLVRKFPTKSNAKQKEERNFAEQGYDAETSVGILPRGDFSRSTYEEGPDLETEIDSADSDWKESSLLPEILSLDDYINSRANGSNLVSEVVSETEIGHSRSDSEKGKELDIESSSPKLSSFVIDESEADNEQLPNSIKSNVLPNTGILNLSGSVNLWEGSLQFTGANAVSVQAYYRSGKETDLKDWPKVVQVEGTLRAETLGDFLRKLPMSRSRLLMIISFHASGGSESHSLHLKEIADQYIKTERVGVANHNTERELYLCPPGDAMWDFLYENGNIVRPDEAGSIGEGTLLGCVVWKQPQAPSKSTHKSTHGKKASDISRNISEHSRNSNRVVDQTGSQNPITVAPAVAVEVSSFANMVSFPPTMPFSSNQLLSTLTSHDRHSLAASQAVPTNETQLIQSFAAIQGDNPYYTLTGKHVSKSSHASQTTESPTIISDLMDGPPGFCPHPSIPFSTSQGAGTVIEPTFKGILGPKPALDSHQNLDDFDELPPGFGPRQLPVRTPQNISQVRDEDDLPDYDFDTLSQVLGTVSNQVSNVYSAHGTPMMRPPISSVPPPLPPGPRPLLQQTIQMQNFQLPPNQPIQHQAGVHIINIPSQNLTGSSAPLSIVANRSNDMFGSGSRAVLMKEEFASHQFPSGNSTEIRQHSVMDDDDMPEWCPTSLAGPGPLPSYGSPSLIGISPAGTVQERPSTMPGFGTSSSTAPMPPLPRNLSPLAFLRPPQQVPSMQEAHWRSPIMPHGNIAAAAAAATPFSSQQWQYGQGGGRGFQ